MNEEIINGVGNLYDSILWGSVQGMTEKMAADRVIWIVNDTERESK